jgi:Asp-tRNA(Asn)/Glu-tRNA(Gln) amidotransferase A subunit family amidase
MTPDEYQQYDATGLAGLVRDKQVSPLELIDIAIGEIESRNPAINAVIATRFAEARAEAAALGEGALGIPWLIKDFNTDIAGLPTRGGSRLLADVPPAAADGTLVERYKAAGMVILGKTNTPEFGMNVDTTPSLFGPTHNPHDPSRSAGGSSGGSAAAVASGMLPACHATDSGGSIRIPASNCGLFGLKPTRARVPLGNNAPEGLAGLSTGNAVSHSVRDSALALDIAAGPLSTDIYFAPPQPPSYVATLDEPLRPLRVGRWVAGLAGESVHPQCVAAADDAATLLASLGHEVVDMAPPIDGEAMRDAFDCLFSVNTKAIVEMLRAAMPHLPVDELLEPATAACANEGDRFTAVDYVNALAFGRATTVAMAGYFTEVDVVLSPVLANPPLPLGELDPRVSDWQAFFGRMLAEIPFTALFNMTRGPAASLPLSKSPEGWPIGVQIGGPLGSEVVLLQLARAVEAAAPWHDRR